MADNPISVPGVRTGTEAYTQAAFSRGLKSSLGQILPLLAMCIMLEGTRNGADGIGVPNNGKLITKIPTARAREKEILGASSYQPFLHSTLSLEGDGRNIGMRDSSMPQVGAGGGYGALLTAGISAGAITAVTVVYGGAGYTSAATVTVIGGGGSGAILTPTITSGAVASVAVSTAGSSYTSAPALSITSAGTSHDQHFERPIAKWCEFADPITVFKKPIRRLKQQTKWLSLAEREVAIGSFLSSSIDEARVVHMTRWSKEIWGVSTTTGMPTTQSNEVWDHLLGVNGACATTNTYAGVDRSIATGTFYQGNRVTSHMAANFEDIFNDAAYTQKTAQKGLTPKVIFCGPTNFPVFMSQAIARGGHRVTTDELDFAKIGFKQPIINFMGTYIVFDPMCPDKLNYDFTTAGGVTLYTKNVVAALNLETFTFAMSPEANFTVDKFFDQSLVHGADALTSLVRTEMLAICEVPPANVWYEDVG